VTHAESLAECPCSRYRRAAELRVSGFCGKQSKDYSSIRNIPNAAQRAMLRAINVHCPEAHEDKS
jgi:hypothetical protein